MKTKNIPVYIDIICCAVLLPAMIVFMPLKYWFTDNPAFVIALLPWLYGVYFVNRRLSTPLLTASSGWPVDVTDLWAANQGCQ